MTIIDKYQQKQVFSFEMFPPKGKHNMEKLHETIDLFSTLKPDFISVTMGAGVSAIRKGPLILQMISNKDIRSIVWSTCPVFI